MRISDSNWTSRYFRKVPKADLLSGRSVQQCRRSFLGIVWKYPCRRGHPLSHFLSAFRSTFAGGSIEPTGQPRGDLNAAGTLQSQILVGLQSERDLVTPCPLK